MKMLSLRVELMVKIPSDLDQDPLLVASQRQLEAKCKKLTRKMLELSLEKRWTLSNLTLLKPLLQH